jgi:hypothetical protein
LRLTTILITYKNYIEMREKMGQPVNCLIWKVAVADLHFWDPEVLTVIGPLHNQQQ